MNIAELAIRKRTITVVLCLVLLFAGAYTFLHLGRLEDPEFTIKEALVITPYPGATSVEVEQEVTDKIEIAVQQLPQLDRVDSKSERGLSIVTVHIKDQYGKETLPQVWDELRRKIHDVQPDLPPGAGPSEVQDDYGDVYGIFLGITGDGYTLAELEEYAKELRKKLLLVKDVAKVELFAQRHEVVYVEMSTNRMSQLGIPPMRVLEALQGQNSAADAGRVRVGPEYLPLDPTGQYTSVKQMENQVLRGSTAEKVIRVRDVAQIKRGYLEPSRLNMRLNGKPAVGLGISIVSGGNVVDMGRAVKKKLQQITRTAPVGMEVGIVSYQSDGVSRAVDSFLINLLEALAIVFLVLLIFMGWRSSLVIGSILLLTIGGTFVAMWLWGIDLQRTSLGALILALGMLVDNAIVVTEGILIKTSQGKNPVQAAVDTVKQTALPLLGATVVAVMAFASIGLSDDATGEYCRSLFQVMLISLGLSWILAVTATPLFCVALLKPSKKSEKPEGSDPYRGVIYRVYRKVLGGALRFRWLTVLLMAALLAASIYSFKYVQKSFFPDSTRPQFVVDCWMNQGDHIQETDKLVKKLETFLLKQKDITSVASFVGQGSMRFALTLQPEKPNPSFAQLMVSVDDYTKVPELQKKVRDYALANCPQAQIFTRKFLLGPGAPGKIRARFSGPDPAVLRELAGKAEAIMAQNENAKDIRTDWRQRTKVVRPLFSPVEAERTGINRPQVATALKAAFEGKIAGVYREGDKLLPIIARSPLSERKDIKNINNLQIFSPVAGRMIPLRQVISGVRTTFEDPIVRRRNRTRTLTVICDPGKGTADTLLSQLKPKIENLKLPTGYELEWGGEYEDSKDSQDSLFNNVPMPLLVMVLSVIMLFNAVRQPIIIFLCVPLSVIGVTAGLLLTKLPFGFMALLGLMSLSGMLIKNAIVLIDQIDLEAQQGKDLFSAISDASVSRVRPVTMAAVTTVLGMIPLAFDAFFNSMAVSIMSGLAFATILTLFVVPVLYAILFKAPRKPSR
ncbi:efflux RND transporter permease subunit [Dethiosulfatarculus sandiegensis]|uniref:Multidrug transporter AcrB n=1 Tax=Dethiosulfatarculus sandiegensis TaxID=1429043 RepID=A0A0D2JZ00_9BACT|nr:efflux RND transporter permease subunit [Dethiosulfatarculus sandiegensis]KIX14785.1 hypothetical protein X474_06480 [Dethiosulfatarculus sandiegensis]